MADQHCDEFIKNATALNAAQMPLSNCVGDLPDSARLYREVDARWTLCEHIRPSSLEGIATALVLARASCEWAELFDGEALNWDIAHVKERGRVLDGILRNAIDALARSGIKPPMAAVSEHVYPDQEVGLPEAAADAVVTS